MASAPNCNTRRVLIYNDQLKIVRAFANSPNVTSCCLATSWESKGRWLSVFPTAGTYQLAVVPFNCLKSNRPFHLLFFIIKWRIERTSKSVFHNCLLKLDMYLLTFVLPNETIKNFIINSRWVSFLFVLLHGRHCFAFAINHQNFDIFIS